MREGTGISLGVAGLVAGYLTALAGLIAVVTYVFVCVYAIVKLIGDAEGHPDPTIVIVGFVLAVSALVLVMLGGVRLIGASLIGRRPHADDAY